MSDYRQNSDRRIHRVHDEVPMSKSQLSAEEYNTNISFVVQIDVIRIVLFFVRRVVMLAEQ